jgi:hypothetical protein
VSRERIVGVSVGAAVVLLLAVGLTCRRDAEPATPSEGVPTVTAASAPGPTRDVPQRSTTPASTEDETDATDERSTFARVAAGRSQHDLHLLAEVQRHLDAAAPPSVHRLLALRDEGASREELATHIDDEVEGMLVQAACRRWLARELEDEPQRSRIGEGGREPAVKPLQRRTR